MTRLIVLGAALASATPLHGAAFMATTPHFAAQGKVREAALTSFTQHLEQFDGLMRTLTQPASDPLDVRPVALFLLNTQDELAKTTNLPHATLGFYTAREHGPLIVATIQAHADPNGITPQMVLFHEYAHHFMLRYFPNAYPSWFVEGFAELYSTAEFLPSGEVTIGKPEPGRLPELESKGLFPLERLFTQVGPDLPADEISHFYGTAWLLTHYLRVSGARPGELDKYLRAVAAGTSSLEAARASFSGGIEGLTKDLDAYRQRAFPYVAVKGLPATNIAVSSSPLSPSREALLSEEIQWQLVPNSASAQAFSARVHKGATAFRDDAYAIAMLAEADWRDGKLDLAMREARQASQLDPKLVRAWLCQAGVAMDAADNTSDAAAKKALWASAKSAIVDANQADQNAPEPLAANFRLYKRMKITPPDIAFDGLYRAHQLVPQNANLTIETAWAMNDRGDHVGAAKLVAPLVNDPHGSSSARAARQLTQQVLAEQAAQNRK